MKKPSMAYLTRTGKQKAELQARLGKDGPLVFCLEDPKIGHRFNEIIVTFSPNEYLNPTVMREYEIQCLQNWRQALPPGKHLTYAPLGAVHAALDAPSQGRASKGWAHLRDPQSKQKPRFSLNTLK